MRTLRGRTKRDRWALSREDYEAVCGALDAGGLVVYPTDTLYGLGCDPFEDAAVSRVYAVKRRPASAPIALALASPEDIVAYAHLTAAAVRFVAKHLPGPVTVLLRATSAAPTALVSEDGLLGIRVPDHPVAQGIAKAFGPLTTTSANLHGGAGPRSCEEARAQLGDSVDVYVDCGPTRHGIESTIVDLTVEPAKVIREGALRREDL